MGIILMSYVLRAKAGRGFLDSELPQPKDNRHSEPERAGCPQAAGGKVEATRTVKGMSSPQGSTTIKYSGYLEGLRALLQA